MSDLRNMHAYVCIVLLLIHCMYVCTYVGCMLECPLYPLLSVAPIIVVGLNVVDALF